MNKNAALKVNQPLEVAVQHIRSRTDLAAFIGALLVDLKDRPNDWDNRDLNHFLEAMSAWVQDMDGYFQNIGETVPDQPDWKTLGQILLAARVYE
jgi:hypothetical protein